MTAFLIALSVLIGGYFVYGAIAEKVFDTDYSRKMPCHTKADGVDFTPMPTWKVFLIQFLNIAGLGPIFGAIMGIMFGPAAFYMDRCRNNIRRSRPRLHIGYDVDTFGRRFAARTRRS